MDFNENKFGGNTPQQPEKENGLDGENPAVQDGVSYTQGAEAPGQNGEPRTPYQTPVREARPQQNGQTYGPMPEQQQGAYQTYGPMPEQEGAQYGAGQQYSSYKQWQQQSKQQKKKGKKPLMVVGGVLAAVMLFSAGTIAGGLLNRPISGGSTGGSGVQSQQLPVDTPKVSISGANTAVSSGDNGLTGDEIYAKVSPSIVSIISDSMYTGNEASGSGIIMTQDGYIITNNHVVVDADKVTVVLGDGEKYQAEVIGLDDKTDLAVLKIEPDRKLEPAEFGDSTKLKVGERAYAIGSPGGIQLQNSFTGGFISAINRDITIDDRVMTLIQTDASINPGNSGGALINQYGQVIGVTSAKLGISYYEGLGFAIPMSTAKPIIDELIAYGKVLGRPAIGISGRNVTEQMSQYYEVPQGLQVAYVDPRSDAYTKGVKRNDIITGINGKETKSMTEINAIKDTLKAGDSITLNIYRAGKTLDITIKLMDETELEDDLPQQQQQENNSGGTPEFPFGSFFQIP